MKDNPLWRYSLRVYARPGVESLLLALQEESGADINLVLACCWLAEQRRQLSTEKLHQALAATSHWRMKCVQPLRTVRQYLKTQAEYVPFRERVKMLELEAEQLQQQRLVEVLGDSVVAQGPIPFYELAMQNLHCYCRQALAVDMGALSGVFAGLIERIVDAKQ